MPSLVTPLNAALLLVLGVAMWSDIRSRRIPNGLTATAAVMALALRAVLGMDELVAGLAGAGLALAVLLPLFALGGVGGGDAKLIVAVGAFLGPGTLAVALLATAVAGGVFALAVATRRRVVLPVLYNTGELMRYVFTGGRSGQRTTLDTPGTLSVPYAIAISAGTLFALLYGAA